VADLARVLTWPEGEAELVTELRSGSESAFDWLVTHYHGPVYGLLAGMMNDPSEAADVTQEVFLKAFRGIRGFRQDSSLRTWLYRIAVREMLNHRRWFWRHLRLHSSIEEQCGEDGVAVEFADAGSSPFDLAATHEAQTEVRRALSEVAPVFRTAVILRDLEGMSYEEVAEVLDISVGTVKSRILRGRRELRKILEPVFAARSTAAVRSSGEVCGKVPAGEGFHELR
jgi:RNA polymerase sigma-70 factor, ECF subfamily